MNEQSKYAISFLIKQPQFFLNIVSSFYPLNPEQMLQYRAYWNWNNISCNENINWSIETINVVKSYLNWSLFSTNSSAFKNIASIHAFDGFIDWEGIDGYEDESFSLNTGINWSHEFIARHEHKINFEKLSSNESVPWSEELINKYKEKWSYKNLAMNNAVPWSISLFEEYLDTSYFFYHHVQANKRFISDIEFIEKYHNYMDWSLVFANPNLPWQKLQLLYRWKKFISWFGVARNAFFFENDSTFFHDNLIYWHDLSKKGQGKAISQNSALPWSIEFIKKHNTLWDWYTLSINSTLPWCGELIEIFSANLRWGGIKPGALLNEEGEIISETGGEIYESGMIENEALPWSLGFIKYFENNIDFKSLSENKGVWDKAFKNIINDDIIHTIIRII